MEFVKGARHWNPLVPKSVPGAPFVESCQGRVSPLQATTVLTTYKYLLPPGSSELEKGLMTSEKPGQRACLTLGLSRPDRIYPLARNWPLTMVSAQAGWMF